MWGNLKDWLDLGCLPDDPELRSDLTGLEYGFNGKSEIQLEKKDNMKKRGLASPDTADYWYGDDEEAWTPNAIGKASWWWSSSS